MKDVFFNEFCKSKNCPEYVKWDFGMGDCESCKLVGQSYNIEAYPKECLFITEIKDYEIKMQNEMGRRRIAGVN